MAQTTSSPNKEPQTAPVSPPRSAPPSDGSDGRAPQQQHGAAAAAVPERPALAPNIVMSGEMAESGFAEPQWMVQRDGQFIHLTELLYHVAEQVDGKRTLEEIAQAMSEQIDRQVSADNVRQLIGAKLIPLGVVVGADGKVAGANAAGEGMARSPLKINMKTKVLPRGLITPATKILKILFFPPILLAVLLVCFAAQAWLFFIHGIAGSIREAVYQPWLTLVLLGIIIVGTAWHEFGHAAALEYGGGAVRGMGMGFYLVYPAFYTDVTDNYRLRRWARVRTDLGGFYFNLIFSLGLIGLYALTGQSFLLLGVLLIDVDIIHQCLPFVRLDGYWTLADLTGIPDFFSFMGPFLRSVLPIKRKEGDEKIPAFKRWVKVVFALYILVTIPILAFLLFVMIKNVPRILATAWDSFHKQGSALTGAWSGGHSGGVALAVVQMVLLALPVAGLGFTLFTLGRTAMRLLWHWAKPTPARRVVGSLATAGLAALLVYLWVPSLPLGGKANAVAARNNWTPIATTERGTLSDAAPRSLTLPYRSPAIAPTVVVTTTAAPTASGTPGATGTPAGTATPGATGTPSSTPAASATPGATAATTPTSIPTRVPAVPQAPVSAPVIVPAAPPASGRTAPAGTAPAGSAAAPVATGASLTTALPATVPGSTTAAATAAPVGTVPVSTAPPGTAPASAALPTPSLSTPVPTIPPTATP